MRNPAIDYIKALAIFLVILGHIITNCIYDGKQSIFNGIISFIHIPVFLFISGFLVKDSKLPKLAY